MAKGADDTHIMSANGNPGHVKWHRKLQVNYAHVKSTSSQKINAVCKAPDNSKPRSPRNLQNAQEPV